MKTLGTLRPYMAALFLTGCTSAVADTLFAPIPGTNNVFDAQAWTNGFPNIANGNGTIASNGVFSEGYTINEPTPGTVTVSHVSGTLATTGMYWNLHNTGGSAEYHWNQSGGIVNIQLLNPNVLVTYTLSADGVIMSNGGGGSRIMPFNSGLFRQLGGSMISMGIELGYGTTLTLSGGNIAACGEQIPSQALWGHGSSAALISISGTHSIWFHAGVSAANAILLQDGAQLVFDPAWKGSWQRENFTTADWITVLSDTGVKVGATQITSGNFNDFFTVAREGQAGSSIQLGVRAPSSLPILPAMTSALLTAHFDASNINNDGGVTDPGPGACVRSWTNLRDNMSLLPDMTEATPTFIAATQGGINGQDTLRFNATASGGDLLYNNAMVITAQTVIAVATLASKGAAGLSTLLSDPSHNLNIRQTTAEEASYFSGNSSDFVVQNSTGSFHINGNMRLDIPGGFGQPHVVKAIRNSPATYNGFRFSDNVAADRRWNGDIAEVLMFDNKLDGNATALVNEYLFKKYGLKQVVDEPLIDTRQVADAPFRNMRLRHIGVNFYYAPDGETAGTVNGIAFDNINLAGATPPSGPFTLSANQPQRTLTLNFPFTVDNSPRYQNVVTTGTDSNTLNTVIGEYFYIGSAGSGHETASMTFSGMGVTNQVYVQILGGDAGWSGDLDVTANDASVGRWMSVSDGNGGTASTFAFMTATDATGSLKLDFTGVSHFAGIAGIILTEAVPIPPPGTIIRFF
jgi:hypothetical protein